MQNRMKFFDHEGRNYVALFPDAENRVTYQDTDTPIVLTMEQAIDLCAVTGLNGEGVILHLSLPYGIGGGVERIVFSWGTPNLGHAILSRVGAIGLLKVYFFKKQNPNL
jgi:hypothetical protein